MSNCIYTLQRKLCSEIDGCFDWYSERNRHLKRFSYIVWKKKKIQTARWKSSRCRSKFPWSGLFDNLDPPKERQCIEILMSLFSLFFSPPLFQAGSQNPDISFLQDFWKGQGYKLPEVNTFSCLFKHNSWRDEIRCPAGNEVLRGNRWSWTAKEGRGDDSPERGRRQKTRGKESLEEQASLPHSISDPGGGRISRVG